MKHTFKCDEGMLITIPLGALKDGQEGELMPDQFHCVFRDVYKAFITKGKPKRVGVAQAIVGLFVLSLALVCRVSLFVPDILPYFNILFMVSGMLTFAAGCSPNMHVAKLSFICNIISFLWSLAAIMLHIIVLQGSYQVTHGLTVAFLGVEMGITLFLIYWFSQCVCRQHFNTLPVVRLQV
uniref:Uncharacterized protein n=1 Tax=Gadus morhua TaxID=8049 RepID=A0A8C5CWC5_GADMO